MQQVQARWFACEADAEAAIAEYEGRGQGRPRAPPTPLAVSCGTLSRRGRHPPHAPGSAGTSSEDGPTPTESGYRLVVEVEALANPEEDNGWTVLATTVERGGLS